MIGMKRCLHMAFIFGRHGRHILRSGLAFCAVIGLFLSAQQPPAPSSTGTEPLTTLKVTTHMVTLQVVARDSKGHPVTGLTAGDFQVTEQVLPKKEQRPQRIATFQQVSVAALAAADKGRIAMPPGVFSNLVTMQKVPVPPTILLVDGLNSNVASQMQVRRQMIKLLGSIPPDIPVAVFLMGRQVRMLQNFTTDPKLLRTAVEKALSLDSKDGVVDPRDDPSALSNVIADNPPPPPPQPPQGGAQVGAELLQDRAVSAQMTFLRTFEREAFTTQVSTRVQLTLDAFRSIARHVAGYPGRKNLLWISSSFPLALFPDSDYKFAGMGEFQEQFAALGQALADAKIAIYPMDPAGLEAQSFYDASAQPGARNVAVGTATSATLMRGESWRSASQESMRQLATQTGGQVCVNNNDLSDCVKKAVDDGSTYYELSYYPNTGSWSGEFHRITLKTAKGGLRLAYREGYYARAESAESGDKDSAKASSLQQAACHDLLTATTILVMAESVPPAQPDQAKYFLAIDPRFLTFAKTPEGRNLSVVVAACFFDVTGKPLQYLQQPTDMKVNEKEYDGLMAQHGFPRTIEFTPPPETARIRLVVRDTPSGQIGSVEVPYSANRAAK